MFNENIKDIVLISFEISLMFAINFLGFFKKSILF